MPAAHERQLPPDRYCPRVQVGGGGGARLELERRREDEDPAQPVQLHVLVLLPLIQLLLTLWPLHDEGHRPFEQQPFEPRSAVVEHVPEPDEEEELELVHDQLADQPERVLLLSVSKRTRMYRPEEVLVEMLVDGPLNRPSCADNMVSPSYSVTKS